MLDRILFSHAIEIEKKSDELQACHCGCGVQWRAFAENDWRCADCLPPPTNSLAKQVRLLATEPGEPATWEWIRGKPVATTLEDSLDNVAVGPVEWESDPTVTDEILAAVEVVRWLRQSKVCDPETTLPLSASKARSRSASRPSGAASLFE